MKAHLLVARPTNYLEEVVRFYRDGLGFEVICEYRDLNGFDGITLGHFGEGYHLEFTQQRGQMQERAPTNENMLVFYIPDLIVWEEAVQRMMAYGYLPIPSNNPYWNKRGKTFEDCDGYRVVLQNSMWG